MGHAAAFEGSMTKHLILLIVVVTSVNAVIFSSKGGCGSFLAVPLMFGWDIVKVCAGHLFADNHFYIVAATGSFLGACVLAILLAIIGAVARKKGRLVSPRTLAYLFIFGGLIYIGLSLLPYPQGPCF
jgi:hypothetical protein